MDFDLTDIILCHYVHDLTIVLFTKPAWMIVDIILDEIRVKRTELLQSDRLHYIYIIVCILRNMLTFLLLDTLSIFPTVLSFMIV